MATSDKSLQDREVQAVRSTQKLADIINTEDFFESNFERACDFLSLWRTNKLIAAVCSERESMIYRLDACRERKFTASLSWTDLNNLTNEQLFVGEPALYWAIRTNSADVFKKALHASQIHCPRLLQGDPFFVVPRKIDGSVSVMKSPLQLAAIHGRLDMVRILVEAGAQLNTCWEAAVGRHNAMIHTHEAEEFTMPEIRFGWCGIRYKCMTALHLAICEGHDDVAKFLLDKGAKLQSHPRAPSALHLAARHKRVQIALYILNHDETGEAKDMLTLTNPSPLHYACKAHCDNNTEMIDILLGNHIEQTGIRANIDAPQSQPHDRYTPLDLTVPVFDWYGVGKFHYGCMTRRLALAGAVSWIQPSPHARSALYRAIHAKWANPLEIAEAMLRGAKLHFSKVQDKRQRLQEKAMFRKELLTTISAIRLHQETERPWDPNAAERSPAYVVELVKLIHSTWSKFQRPEFLQDKLHEARRACSGIDRPHVKGMSSSSPPESTCNELPYMASTQNLNPIIADFSDTEYLDDLSESSSSESDSDDSEEDGESDDDD